MQSASLAAALTAAETRWMTGGLAIAALVVVVLAALILRSQRLTPAALCCGAVAAVASVSCGGIIGWLATPYTPDGTLDDLAAAFGGDGGLFGVLFGAYLWLPVAALALVAWLACHRAARLGQAGGVGVAAGAVAVALSALTLTVSGLALVAIALAVLGGAVGAVVVVIEVSTRTHARRA